MTSAAGRHAASAHMRAGSGAWWGGTVLCCMRVGDGMKQGRERGLSNKRGANGAAVCIMCRNNRNARSGWGIEAGRWGVRLRWGGGMWGRQQNARNTMHGVWMVWLRVRGSYVWCSVWCSGVARRGVSWLRAAGQDGVGGASVRYGVRKTRLARMQCAGGVKRTCTQEEGRHARSQDKRGGQFSDRSGWF